jgi:hypothetical protein
VCDVTAASARRCGDIDDDGELGGDLPVERNEGVSWSASQIPTPNRGALEAGLGRERGRGGREGRARGGGQQRERTDAEAVAQAAAKLERHLQRVEAAAIDARERAVAAERGMAEAAAAAAAADNFGGGRNVTAGELQAGGDGGQRPGRRLQAAGSAWRLMGTFNPAEVDNECVVALKHFLFCADLATSAPCCSTN